MKNGFVYIVGAGPGDPGLIAQKSVEALHDADCVIYDYLANKELLSRLDCEIIYVGKKGGDHTLSQDGINRLIIEKARDGKSVVRLKGGDPFIFGRGGEEAEDLKKEGIPFIIIPGISSFYSAPAYAGIPLTHRDYSNSFEVITGHRRADSPEEDINFPEYNSEKTYVFLMGMKNIQHISTKLINEKNFPENTPVGVISWGTRPEQQVVTGDLKKIPEIVKVSLIKPPAIIVIGGVVKLREKLRWFDNLPLFGKKIVVTRTRSQASVLSKMLAQLGARVVEFPTIEIKPEENISELSKAIDNIQQYNWIIFTSQNAVKIFFQILSDMGFDARKLNNVFIAAIGPATAKELNNYFIKPDLIPSEYVAEEIIAEMKKIGIKGKVVLLPCAKSARKTLKDGLIDLGAKVDRIHIYDSVIPDHIDDELVNEIKSADIISFTSSSTAKNFFTLVKDTNARLACIGPITADAVNKLSHTPDIIASEYTIEGLVKAILELIEKD